MVELNLLKTRLSLFKKKRIFFNFFAIYMGTLILLGILFGANLRMYAVEQNQLLKDINGLKEKIEGDEEYITRIIEKEKKSDEILKTIISIKEKERERVFWSEALSILSSGISRGMWIERLSCITADEGLISIEGYVQTQVANEREAIDKFLNHLNRYESFAGGLSLRSVNRTVRDGSEVVAFNISSSIKKRE